MEMDTCVLISVFVKIVKVKQTRYSLGVAQRVPAS
jgi:hypothetical protein